MEDRREETRKAFHFLFPRVRRDRHPEKGGGECRNGKEFTGNFLIPPPAPPRAARPGGPLPCRSQVSGKPSALRSRTAFPPRRGLLCRPPLGSGSQSLSSPGSAAGSRGLAGPSYPYTHLGSTLIALSDLPIPRPLNTHRRPDGETELRRDERKRGTYRVLRAPQANPVTLCLTNKALLLLEEGGQDRRNTFRLVEPACSSSLRPRKRRIPPVGSPESSRAEEQEPGASRSICTE